jgi:hypothetical protein
MATPPEQAVASQAEALARELHAGQRYYGTEFDFAAYHLEPGVRTIRNLGGTPEDEAIFWLHDTVEDTSATLADLEERGVPSRIVSGVDLLTVWPGQSHQENIGKVANHPQANRLKIIDSSLNLRSAIDPESHMSAEERQICLRKYAGNIVFLEQHFRRLNRHPAWSRFVIEQAEHAKSMLGEPGSERSAGPLPQGLPLPSFAS